MQRGFGVIWASCLAAGAQAGEAGSDKPITLDLAYTAEVIGAADGGIARGARYLDNFDVVATADLAQLVGWRGARAKAYALYNNGTEFTPLVGNVLVTSNIETGVRALRLYEAWIEQDVGRRASLRVGLYDLNSEFDALESADVFLQSAYGIGTDFAQSGRNGPSIFPVTSLAARFEVRASERLKLRLAVLDGVPGDPDRPARTAIKLSGEDGALIVGEADVRIGAMRVIAGAWRYTADFDRFTGGVGRNSGAYVRAEAHLSGQNEASDGGLSGFARFGIADGRVNRFAAFASAGLSYRGLVRGRPDDVAGIAVASAFTSRDYRAQAGVGASETNIELTYRFQATPWLAIQPDVQYVVRPSADPAIADAVVVGLRVVVAKSVF